MAIIYIGMVLVILLLNIDQIVPMIGTIIKSAFGFEQVTGGVGARFFKVLNVVYSLTRWYGFCAKRKAAVPHPVKQGLIQSLGVFFDTMLVYVRDYDSFIFRIKIWRKCTSRCSSYTIALNEHLGSPEVSS